MSGHCTFKWNGSIVLPIFFLLLLSSGCAFTTAMFSSSESAIVDGNMFRSKGIDFKAKKIAIIDFRSANLAAGLWAADMITTEMLFDDFKVLERQNMSKLLEEQGISLSGLVEGSARDDSLLKIGEMLGVDLVLVVPAGAGLDPAPVYCLTAHE